jgi:hypothetical protein
MKCFIRKSLVLFMASSSGGPPYTSLSTSKCLFDGAEKSLRDWERHPRSA